MRDSKSYCAVFADDNNRRPICRFYFNSKTNWQLGIFDANKQEVKHRIDALEDIYKFSKQLKDAAAIYAS